MRTLALTIKRTRHGWGIYLTDGRELIRFCGPGARWRAQRYLATASAGLRSR